MRILLTGASSYVGARLFLDLQKEYDVVGTYSSNPLSGNFIHLDVTDEREVGAVIAKIRPGIIIHAANNASAKWCEANPGMAVEVNQNSTQYIVDAANKNFSKVIYLSSLSAKDTSNMYGKTKAASEKITKLSKSGWCIIRPSLVIGMSPNTSNDRPFNRILKNLDMGTPAVYDTSWKFQPSYLGHISGVIKSAVNEQKWGEVKSVTVPVLKSRYDLAKDILSPFGVTVTPVDNHDTTKVLTDYSSRYSYRETIHMVVSEIRNRKAFVID